MTREEALALEDARCAAMVERRFDELEEMFADDAVYAHSSGVAHDKAGYLRAMREAEFTYTRITRSETNVAFLGGALLLTGRVEVDVVFKTGPRILDSRFLSVWVEIEGRWRFLAWHSTPAPAQ